MKKEPEHIQHSDQLQLLPYLARRLQWLNNDKENR